MGNIFSVKQLKSFEVHVVFWEMADFLVSSLFLSLSQKISNYIPSFFLNINLQKVSNTHFFLEIQSDTFS